jgi:hypothetical protein
MAFTIDSPDEFMDALREFHDTFNDGMLADMVGPTLTCIEANALINLLAAISGTGKGSAAEAWLHGHAQADDEGDDHHETRLWLEAGCNAEGGE